MLNAIPVLLYHRIGTDTDRFTVDPDAFASHVELIARSGRTPLTVTELAAGLRGESSLPDAAVVLTFDDGYADTVTTIRSAAESGIKSTLYVTTGAVNTSGAITAADLVKLAAAGPTVELGAHTVTHPHLDELSDLEAAAEINGSRQALSEMTGCDIRSFAYPHGVHGARIRRLVVDAGFESGVAVKNALSHNHDDPWAIARVTISKTTTLTQVATLLQGAGAPMAWRGERLRTRAYRAKRIAEKQLRARRNQRSSDLVGG